ncbi:MAG: hypothetical protein IPI58_08710 [Alphaproteobacteria bacterium]|nr:MAG: hypothetical protein IPI58_08710 [Alphaproteobacteria bacterium]
MPMHECFSGLFSAAPVKSVARVSGVATPEFGRKSSENEQNTPCNTGSRDGVAQESKETQRDQIRKTPATPETPTKHHIREDFLNCVDRFCAMSRPEIYSAERWAQFQADAKSFCDLWGSQVAALGWNPDSVFAIPDGLIPLIEGGDILAVCEKTAVIRATSRKQFNTIRFKALSGETVPKWHVWASWCEP